MKVKVISQCFYTKDQVLHLFKIWSTEQNVPSKREKIFVSFPSSTEWAEVEWSENISDYGKRLYKITFKTFEV